eukprot:1160499-Pelagomonas_calceolata.AAC.8
MCMPSASVHPTCLAAEHVTHYVLCTKCGRAPIAKVLPGCQDTGTAIVMGKRGQYVWTDGKDEEHLSQGVGKAYTETNLRWSKQVFGAGECVCV